MRERLTLAFVAITLAVLVTAGAVRTYVSEGRAREEASVIVTGEARTMAALVAQWRAAGASVRAEAVQALMDDDAVVSVGVADELPIVVRGSGARATTAPGDAGTVSSTVVLDDLQVTVTRPDGGWSLGERIPGLIALFALLVTLAGGLGYLVARSLSEPFRQLATAAAALGRGRFDLDLPDTRVPEARAIASALEGSATQLRERLERERDFGQHASHVLRTPLTSLRLRLEGLLVEPGLSDEAREAALGCLRSVDKLSDVAGELVEISGRGVLVAGAAVPLRDLATQSAQRWTDVLYPHDCRVSAAVDGDMELLFTPGPVEQVLDQLLEGVEAQAVDPEARAAAVRLIFEGAASSLRVDVTSTAADGRLLEPSAGLLDRLRPVVAALGGRVEALDDSGTLRLHLPRR